MTLFTFKRLVKIEKWLERKKRAFLLKRHGVITTCPYCSQVMQWGKYYDNRKIPQTDFDLINCGTCNGASRWRWDLVYHFDGVVASPKNKFTEDTQSVDITKNLPLV